MTVKKDTYFSKGQIATARKVLLLLFRVFKCARNDAKEEHLFF
jgi:hypothetical protein